MDKEQIAKLKELALKAIEKAPWPFYLTAFHREATPENILELIAEAERAILAAAPAPIQKEPSIPATPDEVIAFIGSNFDASWTQGDKEGWRYKMSVHDLLSAFSDWRDFAQAPIHETIVQKNGELVCTACGTTAALAGSQVQAAVDVLAERERQKQQEGWTAEHDDQYEDGELCGAAACYTMANDNAQYEESPNLWPWPEDWWKPTTKRRNLVKAGALILAEIERLDRAAMREQQP